MRDRNCRQLDDCGAQTWFQGFKHLLPPPGSVAFGVAILENNVLATATLPRDLSPWGMFVNADSVVKAVLIGLAFASLVTWTVWLAKTIEIVICKRRVRAALNILASVRSTSEVWNGWPAPREKSASPRRRRHRVEALGRFHRTGRDQGTDRVSARTH